MGLTSHLRRATLDVRALRSSPAFRRLFTAQLLSQIGSEITLVTLIVQVYRLTHSTLAVGMIGAAAVIPTLVFALAGGAIADAVDRKKLLVGIQVGMMGVSATLAVLAQGSPPVWTLYALAALLSTFAAVDGPTRTAVIPSLVAPDELRSAIQLREVLTQGGRMIGPVMGGLLITTFGLSTAYAVDAATFAIAFALFLGLPKLIPETRRRFEVGAIIEAFTFVGARPVLAATFIADLFAMVLGQQRALFPAYALHVFHSSDASVGYLIAAPATGAVVGLLFAGLTERVRREGLAVLVSVSVWGLAIAAFSQTSTLWVAIAVLAIAGWADMISAIFRQTILLETVPDELRGRMSAVHIMVVTGGPRAGDFQAGAMAELVGIRTASLVGGLGCVAGMGLLAWRNPQFRRWTRPDAPTPA